MQLEVWRGWQVNDDDTIDVYRHESGKPIKCIEVYTDGDIPVGRECSSPPIIPQ